MCMLEACAYVAGEPFSDHPHCVSPALGAFGRRINDRMPDDATRALLIPLIPRMLNTAGDGKDQARAFMCADWAVRVVAPRALWRAGLETEATTLRLLPPLVDLETAIAGRDAARSARAAADPGIAAPVADAAYAAAAWAAAGAGAGFDAYAAYAALSWSEVVEFFGRLIDAEVSA